MNTFFRKLKHIGTDRALRNRILFVIGALFVFRMLAAIPIPGVDPLALERFLASNQFFGILNLFSGGGLSNLSVVMLGVGPYITASIINNCSYCVHSHTAAAQAKGMTDAQHAELLAIVSLAAKTNHLANGLQVQVDAVFDAGASS